MLNMGKTWHLVLAAAIICLLCPTCRPDEKPPLRLPAAYDDVSYYENTPTELELLAQLTNLASEARRSRTAEAYISAKDLQQHYLEGAPALVEYSTPYYASKTIGPNGWMAQIANASGHIWQPGTTTGVGGYYGGYLFNDQGLALEPMLVRGQLGAVLYRHFTDLIKQPVSLKTVDRMLAIYGATPDFPNTYTNKFYAVPDRFTAAHAAARDARDSKGLYTQIKTQFITLQAALNAGPDYNHDRDYALKQLQALWEKAHFATAIYYCQRAVTFLSKSAPTDLDKARALYALGSCIALIHGWKTISPNYRVIAEYALDDLLWNLNAPAQGTPAVWLFATDTKNQLPKLQQVLKMLQDVYDFSAQDMEYFKEDWVEKQKR